MGNWEKLNKTSLHDKEDFYCNLNMDDITDADYIHTKRVGKDFQIKHLVEYHDLHVQSDTLLLADVFKNFQNMCLEIHELGPAQFFTESRLVW